MAKTKLSESERNDMVRDQLRELGDGGAKPRHVVHYTYPNKGSQAVSKADVKSALADLDVRFTDTADREAVILEHQHEVASSDFDEFTRMLRARLEFLGWEYDGWDCAVEADG